MVPVPRTKKVSSVSVVGDSGGEVALKLDELFVNGRDAGDRVVEGQLKDPFNDAKRAMSWS